MWWVQSWMRVGFGLENGSMIGLGLVWDGFRVGYGWV